ncbi:MAG: ATP-binding protein [Eubacteriales bacterium]
MEFASIFREIYGNEQLKATLCADLSADRLSHAYLIEGAPGSGREMLCRTLLNVLVSDPLNRKKLADGNCPDLHIVEVDSGKRFIGIDKIRAMRQIAPIRPNDLDFHVFLIRDAHNLTVQAQNALLKLLEEPPTPAYFFLLCESASSLLATVRSRAPVLRMQSFSPDALREYLTEHSPEAIGLSKNDPSAFDALLHLAGGTIGGALKLLQEKSGKGKGDDLSAQVLQFWTAVADQQVKEIYLLTTALPADREKMAQFLAESRLALRDMAAARQGGTYESLFGYKDEIAALSKKFPIRRILRLDSLLTSLSGDVSASANLNNVKIALADGCRKALS